MNNNTIERNNLKKNSVKAGAICLALAIPFAMMTGCGSGKNKDFDGPAVAYEDNYAADYSNGAKNGVVQFLSAPAVEAEYEDYEADYEEAATADTGAYDTGDTVNSGNDTAVTSRKLIRTINVELETENFDELRAALEKKLNEVGGYIDNEYTYFGSAYGGNSEKYATITVRVPDEKVDAFVGDVSGVGNMVSKTTNTQDVTLSYVDTEGKRDMYLAEEKSLLALLEKAESTEDIAYLISRLSEVRYNIETMESTLRTYDNLVDLATVNFDIREVKVYTPTEEKPQTTGEKLKQQFGDNMKDVLESFRDFGVGVVVNLPYIIRFLLVSGIIVGGCFLIIRGIVKKIKKKAAARKAVKEQKAKTEE